MGVLLKYILSLQLLVAGLILLFSSSANASSDNSTYCGSSMIFHYQPLYQAMEFSFDDIETVIMVNQVTGSGYVYECKCDSTRENCMKKTPVS